NQTIYIKNGEYKLLKVNTLSKNYSEEEISALMAGIEAGSSHPIAQSIIAHSENEGVRPVHFDSIDVVSGAGVEGKANNKHYKLISQKAYEKEIDVEVPKGATLSILVEDDKAIGTVALGDELKSTSKHLIDTLKNH